jgi:2-keto-4-pentenoate hydratase/2-oxohepta-3-ene-1,7-dioic acid hydratase in catechol pathway
MSVTYSVATYAAADGPRAGIVIDNAIIDISTLTGEPSYSTIAGILADWKSAHATLNSAAKANSREIARHPLQNSTLLAPVLYPPAIYCAGANYADHIQEMAGIAGIKLPPDPRALGIQPWHFLKASRTVIGTDSVTTLPPISKTVDWEAELAAVIGIPAKNVPVDKALDYVAGYTIANDLSARDLMASPNVPASSPFRYDWFSHKSFDGSCPLGPWIVPADQIPDPQNLAIKLWVNDVVKQDSSTSRMIFSLAEQIAQLSSRITLSPGDLILTGTPAGVGMARGEFLKPGDTVKISIDRIGTLTSKIA